MELPDDIELEDKELCLVRYHDGEAEIIPVTLEIIDGNISVIKSDKNAKVYLKNNNKEKELD